jgi:transposase-like protein
MQTELKRADTRVIVKIREELSAEKWQLLVAYSIRADGSRELIGFKKSVADSDQWAISRIRPQPFASSLLYLRE